MQANRIANHSCWHFAVQDAGGAAIPTAPAHGSGLEALQAAPSTSTGKSRPFQCEVFTFAQSCPIWLVFRHITGAVMAKGTEHKPRVAVDLIHLVEGMMADGVFVQAEASYLFQWLREHRDHLDQYPFSSIYLRLDNALADGVLDEDEAADIGEFFKRLVVEPGIVDVVSLHVTTLERLRDRPHPSPELLSAEISTEPKAMAPKSVRQKRTRGHAAIDRVLINYLDSMGFGSEREVTVHSCDDEYVKGYCHLRGSARTFRVDRIVGDIVRVETGEMMSVYRWQCLVGN